MHPLLSYKHPENRKAPFDRAHTDLLIRLCLTYTIIENDSRVINLWSKSEDSSLD